MAQVLVRNLDDDIKQRLKKRAARHGISMEAEVRLILANTLKEKQSLSVGLGSAIALRCKKTGLDEPLPELHGHEISPMDL
ncbi:MAG: toxin-antitoxin system [Desulfuromusa sp.]|nr:toxin-antitoxin system [Desulfuromusa sp.]